MEKSIPCYYRITVYSPYCGEEISITVSVSSNDELYKLVDELMADCAGEFMYEHICDWEENGYDTIEEAEEDFYSGCCFKIEKITEEDYRG